MPGQDNKTWEQIKLENAAYQRQKHLSNALQAWAFLLPNFLGFMLITFFPIFFTFFVSFTEYDGFSLTKTKARMEVQFQLNNVMEAGSTTTYMASTARENLVIPKGTKLTRIYREVEQWDRYIPLPYVLLEDVVIPADVEKSPFYTNRTYFFMNKAVLGQWYDSTFFVDTKDGKKQIFKPQLDKLHKDFVDYKKFIAKHSSTYRTVFTPGDTKDIEPKFSGKRPKGLLGIVINDKMIRDIPVTETVTNEDGKVETKTSIKNGVRREIGFKLKKDSLGKEIIIPKGTVIYATVTVKARKFKEKPYTFTIDKDVTIKKGSKASEPMFITCDDGGKVTKDAESELIAGARDSDGDVTFTKSSISFSKEAIEKIMTAYKGKLTGNALEKINKPGKNYQVTPFVSKVDSAGGDGIKWVGFENYRKILFNDDRFRDYFLNTLFFLIQIPVGMAVSLILALAMNQPLKGVVVYRVIFFLPVISNIVAIALLWQVLLADSGVFNMILRAIGISNPPSWFSNKLWAKIAIIIVEVWKGAGYNMMLYLAGLQGIPGFLYEAADIDGANGWQQFWNITWPLLSPTNFFILIMGVIGGFQAFGTQFILTGGGPAGSTTTIVYYIYIKAYKAFEMGYATALAVLLFAFVMVFTAINWVVSEDNVEY